MFDFAPEMREDPNVGNFNNHAAKTDLKEMQEFYTAGFKDDIQVSHILVTFMHKMWKERKLCDVNLVTTEGEIPAHKLVLAAYSDKLIAAFAACKENNPRTVIDATPFSRDAVYCVLEFCYTTDISLNDENIREITTISKQLGIKYLTEICIHYLSQFTVENALVYHSICTAVKLSALSFRIWEFICENFEGVSTTEQFKRESLSTVCALLREDQLKVSSEIVVLEAGFRWLELDVARQIHAEEISNCVRLPLIKAEEIVTRTSTSSLLMSTPGGAEKMYRAMCYHALTVNKSAMAQDYAALPRNGPVKSVFTAFDASQLS